jgi:hypothetical protein
LVAYRFSGSSAITNLIKECWYVLLTIKDLVGFSDSVRSSYLNWDPYPQSTGRIPFKVDGGRISQTKEEQQNCRPSEMWLVLHVVATGQYNHVWSCLSMIVLTKYSQAGRRKLLWFTFGLGCLSTRSRRDLISRVWVCRW